MPSRREQGQGTKPPTKQGEDEGEGEGGSPRTSSDQREIPKKS